jgi:hypothetical protein
MSFEALHLMYRNEQTIFYQEYFRVSLDHFAALLVLVLENLMNNALAACGLFKQFQDCKYHNSKVECTKLSLLPVSGRAHQMKETITLKANHISIHKLPKAFVCYSIPSGRSTCFTTIF